MPRRVHGQAFVLRIAYPANFVPTIVMTEESASDRLFTASKVTAIEFETIPMTALNDARNRFARMPMMLVLTMILSRFSAVLLSAMLKPR